MADEKVSLDIEVRLEKAESIQELKNVIRDAKNEALKFGEGTAEFDKFTKVAAHATDQLGDLNKRVLALDPGAKAQAFQALGSTIVGGMQAATGALAVFTGDNEQLNNILLKSMALVQGLQGIQAIADSKKHLGSVMAILGLKGQAAGTQALTGATLAQAGATNVASVSMKAFRTALISTGVGALVVALGTLIAHWDKLSFAVQNNTKEAQDWKKALSFLMPGIRLAIAAIDALKKHADAARDALSWITGGWVEDANTHKAKVAIDANIEQLIKAKNATEDWAKHEDARIRIMKANGATAEEIYQAELSLSNKRLWALYNEIHAIELKKGKTDEELKYLKDLQLQYADLTASHEELKAAENKRIDDGAKKRADDLAKQKEEQEKKRQEALQFEADLDAEIRQVELDAIHVQLQDIKDKNALLDEENKVAIQSERDKQQMRVDLMQEGVDKEIAIAQLKFQDELTRASGDNGLKLQLIENYNQQVDSIEKKYRDKSIADKRAEAQAKLTILSGLASDALELGDLIGEGQKKQSTLSKVAALTQIGIDTAQAISALVKYSEMNPANAGTFGLAGVAQFVSGIIRIGINIGKAKKLLGGGPSIDTSAGGGGSPPPSLTQAAANVSRSAPVFGNQDRTILDEAERRRSRGQQGIIVDAVFVETNLTTTQKEVAVANNRARRRVR